MADDIGRVSIDELVPSPTNVKDHAVPTIISSLRRFGFADPVVVDQRTGELVAGHGRTKALHKMRASGEPPPQGVTEDWEVPVYTGWASRDDLEADAAKIALNRTTELGGWDEEPLREILDRLKAESTLDGVGYTDKDLQKIRDKLDKVDPPAPEMQFTLELMESQNYVVLLFDNDMDWMTAQAKLGLNTVHALDSREGYVRKGMGRMINGVRVIESLPAEGISNAYEPS
jgi:ParB-like chromosome segregation protein Spo0J